jgi:hypothetical protein
MLTTAGLRLNELERLDKRIDRVALRALKREQAFSGLFSQKWSFSRLKNVNKK